MLASQLWTALFVLATSVSAAPSDIIWRALAGRQANALLRPTEDPFYVGPAGFENTPPGTILRQRPLPAPITLPNNGTLRVKAAWQILYRTTDSVGRPQAVVTTLLIPKNNANYGKVLSYQFAYDSSYVNCHPSYQLLQGADMTSFGYTTTGMETVFVKAALDQGWVVNTPDYEGDRAAFVSGLQAGQATLDSVRAVLKSGSFSGVSPQAKYAMWGYSGGCLASGWASELQPTYAKELNFVGAACGGATPNVTSVLYSINGTTNAGLGPAGIIGLGQAYQNLSAYTDANLVPATAAKFKSAATQCASKDVPDFANEDLFKYFVGGEKALDHPIPKSVLQVAGQQGRQSVPKMPLYYYKTVADEVSKIEDTDALYAKLCAAGANIHYARDIIPIPHAEEAILGAPGAFGWLKNRLDGVPAAKGCSKEIVAVSALSLDALEVFGPFIYSLLLAELGDPSFFPGSAYKRNLRGLPSEVVAK